MKTSPAREKIPGQEVSAPRTRGWFAELAKDAAAHAVGPAHAGMVLEHYWAGALLGEYGEWSMESTSDTAVPFVQGWLRGHGVEAEPEVIAGIAADLQAALFRVIPDEEIASVHILRQNGVEVDGVQSRPAAGQSGLF